MTHPIPVLVNKTGGTAAARGEALRGDLENAFASAGLEVAIRLIDGDGLSAAMKLHADAPLIVVGGGDGTLGCAAQALLERGSGALGILALGTHNHLAKELGIPPDLTAAAKLIAAGTVRRIDVARVNGHLFLNNASVGLYPLMVRKRDRSRLPKWLASIPAARAALRRLPHHRLHIAMPGAERDVVTPMLFVGNNRYELGAGQVGKRAALDAGLLSVFAVAARHRAALIMFALRTLIGRADRSKDFAALGEATSFTVSGKSDDIDIALDGEPIALAMPLTFTIEPLALSVVAPLE